VLAEAGPLSAGQKGAAKHLGVTGWKVRQILNPSHKSYPGVFSGKKGFRPLEKTSFVLEKEQESRKSVLYFLIFL
jgi:hypothetical protein